MSEIISLLWHDHPDMTLDWYEGEKARLPEDELAREIDINYDKSVRSIVFREFKDKHILRGPYKVNPNLHVIRTLDYGKTCACLFSQKDNFGRITFFHELVFEHIENATSRLARAVQDYSNTLVCQGFRDHDDPAGVSDNYNNAEETSYQIVKRFGIHPTHDVVGADGARLRNGVEMIKFKLSEFPEDEPLLRFHESMTYTVDAFRSGYRYEENRKTGEILDTICQEHPHEDTMDCVRITLMEELKVNTPKRHKDIPRQQHRRRNPYTRY